MITTAAPADSPSARSLTGGEAALVLEKVSIAYHVGGVWQRVVHGVSLSVPAGEIVALVGQSGSGKTTLAQAVVGLLPVNGRLEQGAIRLAGTDITGWSQRRMDAIRGAVVSLVPQDPGTSLDPVKTIGDQVAEILRVHRWGNRGAIARRVIELLSQVGLAQPALRARQYPHELSGGMKQRVLIAIAIALRPALIVADESTSALDVTVQRRILDLIEGLRREHGTAVLLVTHDLAVAADRASSVAVLRDGRVEEHGSTAQVMRAPRAAYTRQLLEDAPALARSRHAPRRLPDRPDPANAAAPAIDVRSLTHEFTLPGARDKFRAVDDLSFRVTPGTTHAIVGESGSGKTTVVRAVVGLLTPTSGRVLIEGEDIHALRGEALRHFRRRIQLVYQNPQRSLDPRQTVFEIVEEPLRNFEPIVRDLRARQVREVMERVGLPAGVAGRRPHALSGGQRQRVAIARALILQPHVLVLDEAVSSLDVTVQAQVLKLLDDLQQQFGLTYLFVSHDLAVVRQIAHTVSVMQDGRQVDSGPTDDVFQRPTSDYTRELIDAIPGRTALQS